MVKSSTQHILTTASNLLGFCVVAITSLHASSNNKTSIIDEFVSGIAILLISSCILSFGSMRTNREKRAQRLENIAEYFFIASLLGILVIILLLFFKVIQ
jgi:drug/metabolite transporter (DMT)-like permease